MWTDWQSIADIALAVETRLRSHGLAEGSPVGLILRNHPAMIAAMLGVLLADDCIVTVNASQGDAGLAADIEDFGCPRSSP